MQHSLGYGFAETWFVPAAPKKMDEIPETYKKSCISYIEKKLVKRLMIPPA